MTNLLIVDAISQTETVREPTDEESAQREADAVAAAAQAQAEADALAAREAALAKLAALGLTVDDLTALGL